MITALALAALTPVRAAQLLANPGFSSGTAGWSVVGTPEAAGGDVVFSGEGRLSQVVGIAAGGSYAASVTTGGNGTVVLQLAWWTAGSQEIGTITQSGSAGQTIGLAGTAPVTAAKARITISVTPAGGPVAVSGASLDGPTAPPPATPTATATPTTIPPTATRTTPPAAVKTATATRTPTRPATAAASPTATTAAATPAATSPTNAPPAEASATAAATPSPGPTLAPAYGGLIANGNFERVEDGRPYAWAKFGGTMGLSADAYDGAWSLSLSSDGGGTRWVHQAARVQPGAWYNAAGLARVAGAGEAFFRLSWYASTDGSGTTLSQADGEPFSGGGWTWIASGAKQAPAGANSVRVRLMLRAPGEATAYFDNVSLGTTVAPPAEPPTPGRSSNGRSSGGSRATGGGVVQGLATVAYDGSRTLALSEVLADPAEEGRDSPFEWVEIHNWGDAAVALEGWQVGDARAFDTLPVLDVPPGGYVVIAGASAAIPEGVAVARVGDGTIGSGLNNDGDAVQLLAPDGELVDAMSFGAETSVFDPAPPAPAAGGTIGTRIPGGDPDPANWALTLEPSPGSENTFPAEPVSTAEPARGEGGGDGAGDNEDETPGSVVARPRDGVDPVALVVLGGASGAGAVGAAMGLRRAWPSIWGRFERGG